MATPEIALIVRRQADSSRGQEYAGSRHTHPEAMVHPNMQRGKQCHTHLRYKGDSRLMKKCVFYSVTYPYCRKACRGAIHRPAGIIGILTDRARAGCTRHYLDTQE